MFQISISDFINRVVSSEERIGFSFVDPYGHLSTCRYLELFVNHRVSAPDEQQGISTMQLAKSNIGIFLSHSSVDYLRPTKLGDTVNIFSWVQSFSASGFEIYGVMCNSERKFAHATFQVSVRTVDLATGKPIPLPRTLPCRSDTLMQNLPLRNHFIKPIKGIPACWFER